MPEMILSCDVCSVNGGDVTTTKFFAEGSKFDIDVCPAHEASLSDVQARLASYAMVGRSHPTGRNRDASKVRVWARQQGLAVGERGRISADVHKSYQRAMEVETLRADVMST